jgi:hypothetical protein
MSRATVIPLPCKPRAFLNRLQRLRGSREVACAAFFEDVNSRFCNSANNKALLRAASGTFSDLRALYVVLTPALYGGVNSTAEQLVEWARHRVPNSKLPSTAKFLASAARLTPTRCRRWSGQSLQTMLRRGARSRGARRSKRVTAASRRKAVHYAPVQFHAAAPAVLLTAVVHVRRPELSASPRPITLPTCRWQ